MSNLIKKVKIMQQDGTFTDYIPLGADAENINVDGESVEIKLGKKPYYYNTVADMKADTKLKVGDMAVTLGYYSINDGGGARYKISTNNVNDIDNMRYFLLNNNLLATYIIFDKNIPAESVGFKKNDNTFDNSVILENFYLNNNFSDCIINFGIGTYYFDETFINQNHIRIRGVFTSFTTTSSATIFKTFRAGQRFLLKIGGKADFSDPSSYDEYGMKGCLIDKILFTDSTYHLAIPVEDEEKYGLLCLEYNTGCKYNIGFRNTYSRCIYIKNCWELDFENLAIRGNYLNPLSSLVYIDSVLWDGSSNTSCLIFKNIDLENINCKFMSTNTQPNMTNILIDTLSLENGRATSNFPVDNGKIIQKFSNDDFSLYHSCILNPLFDVYFIDGLSINILNLHNFANGYYSCLSGEEGAKYVDSLFRFNHYYNVTINQINLNHSGAYITIADGSGSYLSNCDIGLITMSQLTSSNISTTGGAIIPGYVFYNTAIGNVNIIKTNAKINPSDITLLHTGVYMYDKLYQLSGKEYNRIRLQFDESIQDYVLCNYTSSINTYFLDKSKVNHDCNIIVRGKLNNNVALNLVLVKDGVETIKSVSTTAAERNIYKNYVYENINTDDYDYFYIKLAGGGTLMIHSIEIQKI